MGIAKKKGSVKEYCRQLVVKLLQSGKRQIETAKLTGLSQSGVSRIWSRFQEEGEEGLSDRHSPGAPPKLDADSKAKLPELLSMGPQAYGFEGNLWTRRRVQRVIQEQFGVTYSEGHVGTLLKELGFSQQKPRRRDNRQNPERVRQWRAEQLPAFKKKAREEARLLVYIDEAGFGLLPALGKTWSLRGHPPLLEQGCRYQHLSVISAVTETGGFYYAIQESSFKGENVVAFLRQLSEETSYPLLVIWDNASIHRAKEVKGFLTQENAGWIHLEAQPGYSPELNADEQAWNWMKYHQLKNVCCKTLSELKDKVQQAANRLKSSPSKVRSFFAHPELGFFMRN